MSGNGTSGRVVADSTDASTQTLLPRTKEVWTNTWNSMLVQDTTSDTDSVTRVVGQDEYGVVDEPTDVRDAMTGEELASRMEAPIEEPAVRIEREERAARMDMIMEDERRRVLRERQRERHDEMMEREERRWAREQRQLSGA